MLYLEDVFVVVFGKKNKCLNLLILWNFFPPYVYKISTAEQDPSPYSSLLFPQLTTDQAPVV